MQWQVVGTRVAATGRPGAAVALCVAALCAAATAQAQVTVGGVRIDVRGGDARATAQTVLTAIGAADRAARERRGGRATTGRRPGSGDGTAPTPAPGAPAGGTAARVLPTAERYLGVPYRWGGTSPRTGFDCSGFVQYVFAKHGTRLPRTSRQQASAGQRLRPSWSALRAGDLVMFARPGERISHVAIYAGRRRIIHATGSGKRVRYDALDTPRGKWFARHLVAARRVSPRGPALVRELLGDELLGLAPGVALDPPDAAPAPDPDH